MTERRRRPLHEALRHWVSPGGCGPASCDHGRMDDAELGQQLATRAMSLVRAGADRDAVVRVLIGLARGRSSPLELGRARCAAAVDQHPADHAAADAVTLLDRARDELG